MNSFVFYTAFIFVSAVFDMPKVNTVAALISKRKFTLIFSKLKTKRKSCGIIYLLT